MANMNENELAAENRFLSDSLANTMLQLRKVQEEMVHQAQTDADALQECKSDKLHLEAELRACEQRSLEEQSELSQEVYVLETENQALLQRTQALENASNEESSTANLERSGMMAVLSEVSRYLKTAQELALPDFSVSVVSYEITGDEQLDEELSGIVACASGLATSIKALKQANKLIRERLRDTVEDLKAKCLLLEKEKNSALRELQATSQARDSFQQENKALAEQVDGFSKRNDEMDAEVKRLTTLLEETSANALKYQQTSAVLQNQFEQVSREFDELKYENESAGKLLSKARLEIGQLKAENEQFEQKLLAFASVDREIVMDADECCDFCCKLESEGLEHYLAERLISVGAE